MSSSNDSDSGPGNRPFEHAMRREPHRLNRFDGTQRVRSGISELFAMERASKVEAGLSHITCPPARNQHTNDQPSDDDKKPRHSQPIPIPNSSYLCEDMFSTNYIPHDGDFLRNWATGYPPRKSYLNPNGNNRFTSYRLSSYFDFMDQVNLDPYLKTTLIKYEQHTYLPLLSTTILRLSPLWAEPKPIINPATFFNCLMVNEEINATHADHVIAALRRIGAHCRRLIIWAPVSTSELGNVFSREEGDLHPGNDWDHLLACLPNLERLAFVHPQGGWFETSTETLNSLRAAVARRQAALAL